MNIWTLGWKEPTKCYMLGYLRELWIPGSKNLIFNKNSIAITCNESNNQLYFLKVDNKIGDVKNRGITDYYKHMLNEFKDFHFGAKPNYPELFTKGSLGTKIDHPTPPDGRVEFVGCVSRIDYFSKKKNLKDNQSGIAEYKHTHKEPYPMLAVDRKSKQLFYIGGCYYVSYRGIIS